MPERAVLMVVARVFIEAAAPSETIAAISAYSIRSWPHSSCSSFVNRDLKLWLTRLRLPLAYAA